MFRAGYDCGSSVPAVRTAFVALTRSDAGFVGGCDAGRLIEMPVVSDGPKQEWQRKFSLPICCGDTRCSGSGPSSGSGPPEFDTYGT